MRTPLLCATALALALATFGCGGGGGGGNLPSGGGGQNNNGGGGGSSGGTDTAGPVVTNGRLSATSLDFSGGTVSISVDATDPSGVQSVVATIQRSGGTTTDVGLSLSGGSTYAGNFIVPANQSTSGAVDTYTVSVKATDTLGNSSTATVLGTISVSPADALDPVPPPPSWSGL